MSSVHAIIDKRVINLDHAGDRHVCCAWDDCERDGFQTNLIVVNYGTAGNPQLIKYVFCTERHKQFWANSHRQYGVLPPGFRRSFI